MSAHVGREKLVQQAVRLFRAKGYSATSVDEIVRACGTTKGGLYHHFSGKDDLVIASIERVHDLFSNQIFCLIDASSAPGVKELKAFNAAVEAFFSSHPEGCLVANLCLDAGVADDRFRPAIRRFFADWRACYARVFAAGRTPTAAAALADDALAIVHGCILMLRVDGDLAPLRRQHRKLLAQAEPRAGQDRD